LVLYFKIKIINYNKKLNKIIHVLFIFLIGCGGGDFKKQPIKINFEYTSPIDSDYVRPIGTMIGLFNRDGDVLLEGGFQNSWNTYCQNDYWDLHFYQPSKQNGNFELLGKPDDYFKSGFIWKWDDFLFAADMGDSRVYKFDLDGSFQLMENPGSLLTARANIECGVFVYGGYKYFYSESLSEDVSSVLYACDSKNSCSVANLPPKTWIYSYASEKTNVFAGANDGGVYFHDQEKNTWCEASYIDEEYFCLSSDIEPIRKGRTQFYSSIQYGDATLIGMWPGGFLFEFRDGSLKRWAQDSLRDFSYNLAEAQSLSIYCGNLYVGYWPWGELYKYDGTNWNLATRLFSAPEKSNSPDLVNYPYFYRALDGESAAFYGERISGMIPYGQSLIVSTSNLSSWGKSIGEGFISEQLAHEYGLIYTLTQEGCLTAKVIGREKKIYRFSLEIEDYELKIVSDYGVQVVKTTFKKSDVVKVAIPKSGAFGVFVGGVLTLTDIKGI
jgi:hypothetical protein